MAEGGQLPATAELLEVEFKMRRLGDAMALRDHRVEIELRRRVLRRMRERFDAHQAHAAGAAPRRSVVGEQRSSGAVTGDAWEGETRELEDRLQRLNTQRRLLSLATAEVEWTRQEKERLSFRCSALRHELALSGARSAGAGDASQ
eukprot:TRINITY_DN19909_c0_g1_i1.p1 TRINITY_DN19909_c0_g1~~TRINITY_DN19909_c0_g1_i1.p1  ORF type:complete len:146 (+),score=47.01 TRINITY_DN19909_c0_g1_i1:89-526(+)